MKSVYTKILSVALVLSFVIPNTFFLYPKKVEATGGAESCAAGYVIAGVSKVVAAISSVVSVPSESAGNNASNYQQEASAYSGSFTECILRPLGQQILLVLVRNIGASVVEWVNSGFEGKPLFVTDFEGLLTDTADGVIGSFIEGSELGWLCNDFSAQIRLSLALKYSKPTREKFKCTVSDIANNAENFLENNGGRGWDNWLTLTTEPQNNVYGAYFTAQSELAQRVAAKIDDKNKEVLRNNGFLDFKYCPPENMETMDEAIARVHGATSPFEVGDPNLRTITQPIPQCKEGGMRVGTPGTIIGSKLSSVINQSEVQNAVAQEIDQVIGAVLNQLAQKAMNGAQGILGLSKKKSIQTGSSYLAKYRQELYGVGSGTGGIVIPATSETEDYRLTNYRDAIDLINTDPTTRDILATTSRITNEITEGQAEANEEILNNQTNPIERNIALLRPSRQSSSGPANASNAVNGINEGNVTQYLPPSITGEEQNPWWQTNLGRNTAIREVRIWRVTNKPVSQTLEQIQVIVYDENNNQVWQSSPLFPSESSPNPIIVPVGVSGYSVRIQKYGTLDPQCRETFSFDGFSEYESCYRPLELVEVEVIETVTAPAGGGFSTSTIPTNPTGNTGTGGGQTGGVNVTMQSNSTITSNTPLSYTSAISSASARSGIRVETHLLTSNGTPIPFSNIFSSLDLYHGRQNGVLSLHVLTGSDKSFVVIPDMVLNPNNGYRINLSGTKRVGVSGSYVIEVRVFDGTSNNLTTQRVNFVVQ